MREIKFRAWNDESNAMGYFTLKELASSSDTTNLITAECPVMQFTGLKDKNRKKIYEGDIVRLSDNVIHEGILVKCIWNENRIGFIYEFLTGKNKSKCTDMVDDWRKYEVIGNIYENPELLKEDKK